MLSATAIWFGTEDAAAMKAGVDAVCMPVPMDPAGAVATWRAAGDAQARPALIGPGEALAAALACGETAESVDLSPWTVTLAALREAGAAWAHVHEPLLGTGLAAPLARALRAAYETIAEGAPKLMLSGAEGAPGPDIWTAAALPVAGLHLDLVHSPLSLRDALDCGVDKVFALGLIDGASAARTDLAAAARWARVAMRRHGAGRIEVALASPALIDAARKLEETVLVARIAAEGEEPWRAALAENEAARKPAEAAPRRAAEA